MKLMSYLTAFICYNKFKQYFLYLSMNMLRPVEFDFEIDRLTNSIENVISGDSFDTTITQITVGEQKQIKKADWLFDWKRN